MTPRFRKLVLAGAATAWLAAAAYGMKWMADYALTPGESGVPATHWPAGSALGRLPDRATLVVGIHPECPCSRATVEELNTLIAECPADAMQVIAVFGATGRETASSGDSALWADVGRLPGVARVADPDGAEMQRFALRTSGEVRVYAADGTLRYAGGITGSRGHVGANAGRSAARAAVCGSSVDAASTELPVFGCALGAEPASARAR